MGFRNGYARNAPEMLVEFRGLRRYGNGRCARYAIPLGRILKISTLISEGVILAIQNSGISAEISRHLQDRSRRRSIAHKPHIQCEPRHHLQGSPYGGVYPVRAIAEGTPAQLREQNDV